MILVNIGCGAVHHPAWVNLDSAPSSPEVRRCDVRAGLPFADGSVDVVYHAHVLEHLEAADARAFLAECRRVLKPGGILRVVVPDLEGIAEAYSRGLATARSGGDATLLEWARLEMTDQAARSKTGGEMARFLQTLTPEQIAVVRIRAGGETDSILKSTGPRRRRPTPGKIWLRFRREIGRVLLFLLGGRRFQAAFDEGWFRQSGEVHRVMYDQLSLARLLSASGFSDAEKITAFASRIPGYAEYALDVCDGAVRKPDSLFMEAVRR